MCTLRAAVVTLFISVVKNISEFRISQKEAKNIFSLNKLGVTSTPHMRKQYTLASTSLDPVTLVFFWLSNVCLALFQEGWSS